MSFRPLKKLIERRLKKRDIRQGVTESEVQGKTEEIIKEDFPGLYDQVKILNVQGDKIVLKASNPGVAQEIQLNQQQIIKKVNRKVKQAEIKRIIFRSKS